MESTMLKRKTELKMTLKNHHIGATVLAGDKPREEEGMKIKIGRAQARIVDFNTRATVIFRVGCEDEAVESDIHAAV
jgi:hypothetical protein